MKRILLVLLFLALAAALPVLSAEIPTGTAAASPGVFAALAGPVTAPFWANPSSREIHLAAACLFPRCQVDPDGFCTCEWIFCNGHYICGQPLSFSAASQPSLHL